MMRADRGGAAKYARIASDLRSQIMAGTLGIGDRVPSEPELTERYGVSKTTAARALEVLAAEGTIERRAGSGSFVIARPDALVIEAGPGTRVWAAADEARLIVEAPGDGPQRYPIGRTIVVFTVPGPAAPR
jgi:DNA-binding FadR family transcriptional regulator